MDRLQPLGDDSERAAIDDAVAHVLKTRRAVARPFEILLRVPELCIRVADVGELLRFKGRLSDAVRETAIVVTARVGDCRFEAEMHLPIARAVGVATEICDWVMGGPEPMDGPADQLAAMRFCRELVVDHQVSDSAFAEASDLFGEAGVVLLAATAGYYLMLGCVINAFEPTR